MFSVFLFSAESPPLPSVMVGGNFSTATQFTLPAVLLQSEKTQLVRRNPMPGTVGELVAVLVEFVFPFESGVTYLSNPRLMTTQETVFSICTELILISIQYLPH